MKVGFQLHTLNPSMGQKRHNQRSLRKEKVRPGEVVLINIAFLIN